MHLFVPLFLLSILCVMLTQSSNFQNKILQLLFFIFQIVHVISLDRTAPYATTGQGNVIVNLTSLQGTVPNAR